MGVIGLKVLRGSTIMSQIYIKQLYDNVYITKHFCAFLEQSLICFTVQFISDVY